MAGELSFAAGDPYRLHELRAQGVWPVWHLVYDGIDTAAMGLIAQRSWLGTGCLDHLHVVGPEMAFARRERVVEDDSEADTTTTSEWDCAGPLAAVVAALLELPPPEA